MDTLTSSDNLEALYQEIIIDHGTNPKNFKKMEHASLCHEGYNALCGDQILLFLKIEQDKIIDASFQGQGCAISIASASMMCEMLINKTKNEANIFFRDFQHWITNEFSCPETLGKLKAFSGVRSFPLRIKCATLPWHTLNESLSKYRELPILSCKNENDNEDVPLSLKERIIESLKSIYDPEIPVNIYDLGLIYEINEINGKVNIQMTLTSPGCPVAGTFPQLVQDKVLTVNGVESCSVDLVWDPPWTRDNMSEVAKLQLNLF